VFLAVFGVLFLFSLVMIMFSGLKITGLVTSSTTSNVTVSKSFAIALSTNLSEGIKFGNLSTVTEANATSNNDLNVTLNTTGYFINVSTDATINVDICIKANSDMTSSDADVIGLANETYSNATTNSGTVPAISQEVSLTTSGVKAGQDLSPGDDDFFRFWLNISSTVPTGDYNNTITFEGLETGTACT